MPTVLIIGPYRLFFWSYDCSEPPHIHIKREKDNAKFWLEPVSLASNHGFKSHELRAIERIIQDNLDELRRKWDEHCA